MVLWKDAAQSVRVVLLSEPQDVETLISLFEVVANSEGWQPEGALRLWTARSVYFALYVQEQLVGGLQMVLPETTGTLPCQTLWPEVTMGTSSWQCAHIVILALEEAYRGQGLLFWRLAVEMWRWCVGEGIASLFIEVTPRVLPIYQRLGWPLNIVGALRPHWGEECYLCTLGIPEVAETLLRRAEHSSYYRQIIAQAFRVTITVKEARREEVVEEALLTGTVG